MSNLEKMESSALAGELDLNFTVDVGGKAKNHVYEATDRSQVDLDQESNEKCTPSSADFRHEHSSSPYDKDRSVTTEFNNDGVKRAKYYDEERSPSLVKENNNQGEMDELQGSYFHKSSFQYKAQTFQSEKRTEDYTHSQESPLTTDANQADETKGNLDLDPQNFFSQDWKVKNDSSKKSEHESTKSVCNEMEEATDHQMETLVSLLRSPSCGSQYKDKNYGHKGNSPTESIKPDMPHSVSHSRQNSPRRSTSPVGKLDMSASPEESPCTDQSPSALIPMSLQKSIPDLSNSSISHRRKNGSSPERSALVKEIPLKDHLSLPAGRMSTSPGKSERKSRYKDDSSRKRKSPPKRNYSPQDQRRRKRSASRSPTRGRDLSSGYRRGHHGGSPARSSHMRDCERSSRRRYSPRRTSPHHPSPRRRPWSPPPNRRTGIGKPGKNLFVAGFSFLTTERDLERKFSRFGRVRDVRIVRDKRSGDSRGFGFLTLERDVDADAAIRALDETEWNGRIILVEKTKSTGR